MKDKFPLIVAGSIFGSIMILLMLIDDGVFGEEIKDIFGWVILVLCGVLLVTMIIANLWYKFRKEGR